MFFHSKEFVFVALCVISRCLGDEEDTTSGGGGGGGGSQSSSGGGGGGSSGGSGSSGGGGFSSGANWITIGGGGGGGGVTIGTGVGAGGQSFMTVGTGGSAPSVFALGGGGASVAGGAGVVGVAGGAGGAFVSSGGSMMSSAGSGFGQCPWWAPPVICFEPPCFSNPVCPAIRNARCVNNNCGRCSSRFFVGPIEVTAFCNIQQGSYCPPWRPQAYCYVDPCRVNSCPVVPYATCRADYCGGCHARYYLNGYEVTSLCHKHVYPRSQAVSFHQAKPIIAKPIHHTHVTHTHHHYKHHLLHHMHHKSGKVF